MGCARRVVETACVAIVVWLVAAGIATAQVGGGTAPTNVRATQVGSTLTVSWNASLGAPPGYVVLFHRGDVISSATFVGSITTGPETSVSLTVPPGTQGTFTVLVRPIIDLGPFDSSTPVTFTVGGGIGCAGPPAAPTGLTGVRLLRTANIRANASALATQYTLLAGTGPGGTDLFAGNIGNVPTAGSDNVDPGIPLYVRLVAANACGLSSPSAELFLPPGNTVGCAPDPTTMCLFNGRFVANLNRRLADGTSVPAAVTRRFNDGGGFTFDGATENVFLRFSDECRTAGRYEVTFTNRSGFPAATGFELFVGDQVGSISRLFQHPAGTPFVSFTDSTSFRRCDGFFAP